MNHSLYLLIAGCLSCLAALLHIGVIVGGPEWYRFFGAGEQMARLAESGSLYPSIVTSIIAAMLFVWGLYAFSAAGVIVAFPLIKLALPIITAIYLIRGLAGLTLPFLLNHPAIAQNSHTFWIISSLICLVFGGFYLVATLAWWGKT